MSAPLSLRGRVILGAVLWTIGLFILGGVALTLIMAVHPQAPAIVHHWFMKPLVMLGALASMTVGFLQVRVGLSGFNNLRSRLAALHEGRQSRVEGSYPIEIQPLVTDLNALLDQRDQAVRRAVAKAGDLAHGLKTPLAILTQDATGAEVRGLHDIAQSMQQQIDKMRRQVDYHLAHARAAASSRSPGTVCPIRESVEGLARAMRRLHADTRVTIDVAVAPDHSVRTQREDLDEMLGNLLDNACKWARSRVTVGSSLAPGCVVITVDDDGPGLPDDMRTTVLRRGVRADEATSGSGLGLAIVCDLAGLYGGALTLDDSPPGGLRARLTLPG